MSKLLKLAGSSDYGRLSAVSRSYSAWVQGGQGKLFSGPSGPELSVP